MLAFVLFASTCLAQQDPPQDLAIRVNVNLIQIDVTVLDKSRQHVPGLTAQDFDVFRDGKRQVIKKVLYVSKPLLTDPTKSLSSSVSIASAVAPVKQLQAKDVRRTMAIFIDDLSIDFANLSYTRDALRKFVEEQLLPGDILAIYSSSGGLGLFQQFTTDKRAILAGIDRMRLRNLNGMDSLAPLTYNPLEDDASASIAQMALDQRMREETAMRSRQDMLTAGMLSTAAFIVRGLREMPGRKSMVIFSESMQLSDTPQALNNPGANSMLPGAMGGSRDRTRQALQSLIDVANRSGVTFYTVDPRGLQVLGLTALDTVSPDPRKSQGRINQRQSDYFSSQDGMAALADETGGLFFANTNDLGRALSEAANDQDGYYLVAFQPDEETFEKTKQGQAKNHKLSIKIRRPGLKVRFRKSFAGIADVEPNAANTNPLVSAMSSPFRSVEIPVKLTPLYLEADKTGPLIRAVLVLDPKGLKFEDEAAATEDKDQTPWKKAVADELVMLYDQRGKVVDQVSQTQTIRMRKAGFENAMKNGLTQVLDIPVKEPGPYQLRAAVMDTKTRHTGSSAQFVFVPDVRNKQLAMSDVTVAAEAFLQAKSADGSPGLRVMHGGDKLTYGAYIYNAKLMKEGSKPNLECQIILYREGKAVYTGKKTPYQPEGHVEGRPMLISGSLSLGAKIAAGDYVLQVAIRDLEAPKKYQFAMRSADFEVRVE